MVMEYLKVDWSRANCVGTDWRFFYSDKDAGFVPGESKGINNNLRKICARCPILNDCANYSIEHEQHGFWAGMAEDERREVRNGRKTRPLVA
jgi:hypothetical protein